MSVPASADILVESHRGQRPADAAAVLRTFRDELERSGVKVQVADVLAVAGDQLPLPGVSDTTLDPHYAIELAKRVELGTKQVFHGDYAEGLTTLEAVLHGVRENPGLVVTDTSSPKWLTKAYAAIAFAQIRSQHPDAAAEAVAEQIRSFPAMPIGRIVGPEVATLADKVRKTLDASSHGTLRIVVSRPDVQVFVNEQLRELGRSFLSVAPGVYRVLLAARGISRRYLIRVRADKPTDLYVDWDADAAFGVATDWIGFAWPREKADTTEAVVSRYARGSRKDDVFVASIIERSGRRLISGEIFEKATGALLRHRAIEVAPGDDVCKRALAQYLLTGNGSNCLIDPATDVSQQAKSAAASTASEPTRSRAPIYVASGIAAAAFITGGYLLHINGEGTCGSKNLADCPYRYATASQAWALLGAGAAAVGFGVYWRLRASDIHHPAAISLVPTRTGVLAAVQGDF